jgi:hypothetical protein
MKIIRITIVMVGFFLAPFFVHEKDYVAALAWTLLLLANVMILVGEKIIEHIDEKKKELLDELKKDRNHE